ncbi:MAG: hypoxanthine-DNA glycosylase [Rhodoferax sp.]
MTAVQQPMTSPPPPRLTGLAPVVSGSTRLLILGSFPGKASLAQQQYYAHPQNQFWKILQAIWPASPGVSDLTNYENRRHWLLARGLGVWDVYAACERKGSLDTAIRQAEVNDFAQLWQRCPQLTAIAHNGGESFKQAHHVLACLNSAGAPDLPVYKLPSTSPAHASWSFERKLTAWREVMVVARLF